MLDLSDFMRVQVSLPSQLFWGLVGAGISSLLLSFFLFLFSNLFKMGSKNKTHFCLLAPISVITLSLLLMQVNSLAAIVAGALLLSLEVKYFFKSSLKQSLLVGTAAFLITLILILAPFFIITLIVGDD